MQRNTVTTVSTVMLSAAPEPAPAGVSGTFDGSLVTTREGHFPAEIIVCDNAITAVNVTVGGDSREGSVAINWSALPALPALPALQERLLSAQTWAVQGIRGASATVQGFLGSVKDAMAQGISRQYRHGTPILGGPGRP